MALDFGDERSLVRVVEAGDAVQLAGAAAAIDAFAVALFDDGERGVDVDFDEAADAGANLVADGAVGRDRGDHRDYAVAGEQLGDKANAADVLVAILLAEAEAF